jgi:hypothetical protein
MRPSTHHRDEGAVLILALVLIIVCSMIAVPLATYVTSVLRAGSVRTSKLTREEAVKGGLRVALADPAAVYKNCGDNAGPTTPVALPDPKLNTGVTSRCYNIKDTFVNDNTQLRFGVTTTQAGTMPPAGLSGSTYPSSPAVDPSLWLGQKTDDATPNKIWAPLLPLPASDWRDNAGKMMPAGNCRVYFPGTYLDPLTISGGVPVFFTSGIYYFENTVTFSADANVVVGEGFSDGCTTDQEAVFNAINAPVKHNISGKGAMFIFGALGNLVVDNAGSSTSLNVVFNRRYAVKTDPSSATSQDVSIASVNGSTASGSPGAYNVPGVISVPLSMVASATTANPATSQGYTPSLLVAGAVPAPANIVSIAFSSPKPAKVVVPGYIFVPQGYLAIAATAGSEVNKDVRLTGGLTAAAITVSNPRPVGMQAGLVSQVVQKTFKIISETTSGSPHITSVAVVQINQVGGDPAINSWVVQRT